MSPTKVSALFPVHFGDSAIGHVLYSLYTHWKNSDLDVRIVVQSCEPKWRKDVVTAIPPQLGWWYYRFSNPGQVAERRFLKDLHQFDAAYLYPGVSLETVQRIRQAKKPIFLERVNTYQGNAKQILDDAYSKLGLEPAHSILEENIQREDQDIALADFLLCPSLNVTESYRAIGIPDDKLITVSEGWAPERFPQELPAKPASDEVTVLFLGSVCVRKGIHLLLRAWERAGIKGRLIVMGGIEPAIAELCAEQLSRSDVTHIPFSRDYTTIYRQADIFALPSLEEGSPLVTYEAMGNGLPVLGSPMGGGGIVRHEQDGFLIPPYAEEQWIEALRLLANNPDLRQQMGASARMQAQEYTWQKVAQRRGAAMIEKIKAYQAA